MSRTRTAPSRFERALEETDEIEISVIGRKSGRKVTHPVWFVHEDGKIYLLPLRGTDTQWYKNLQKNRTITLAADGTKVTATARLIRSPEKVREVIAKFRRKYGAADVKRYYSKFDAAVEVRLNQ